MLTFLRKAKLRLTMASLACLANTFLSCEPVWGGSSAPSETGALPLSPLTPFTYTVNEGTWLNLDVSPDGSLVVFEMVGQIFVLPIEGGAARQLTTSPAFSELPQFSPTGQEIVFSSDRTGPVSLWKINLANSGQPMLVPVDEARNYERRGTFAHNVRDQLMRNTPVFTSRDGRFSVHASRVVRDEQRGCRNELEPNHLILVDHQNRSARHLATTSMDCSSPVMPRSAFTPAGDLVTSYGGKIWKISLPDPQSSLSEATIREIPFEAQIELQVRRQDRPRRRVNESEFVEARRIENPALSPDGRYLAFSAFHRLWIMDMISGRASRVTDSDDVETAPAWSPDGRLLAFAAISSSGSVQGEIRVAEMSEACFTESLACVTRSLVADQRRYSRLAFSTDATEVFAVSCSPMDISAADRRDGPFEPRPIIGVSLDDGAVRMIGQLPPDDSGAPDWANSPLQVVRAIEGDEIRFGAAGWDNETTIPAPTGNVARKVVAIAAHPGTVAPPRTLLEINFPSPLDDPGGYVAQDIDVLRHPQKGASNRDTIMSPDGRHALLLFGNSQLVLARLPDTDQAGARNVRFDLRQTNDFVSVSDRSSGADFATWVSNDRFTYSFGRRFYDCEIRAVSPLQCEERIVRTSAPRDLPEGTIVLRNARLITMRGGEVIERGDLIVRNRRIVAIGVTGSLAIPDGARFLNLDGSTIIPGIVDVHNHHSDVAWNPHPVPRLWEFEANLALGVLASRDPQDYVRSFMTYEDRLATGQLLGPRYENTGPGINIVTADYIGDFAAAREIVDRYASIYGVSYLKDYALELRNQRQWLAMAAAERDLGIVSHGQSFKQLITNAIDGINQFDHSLWRAPLYDDVRQLLRFSGLTLGQLFEVGGGALWGELLQEPRSGELLRRVHDLYPPEVFQELEEMRTRMEPKWWRGPVSRVSGHRPAQFEASLISLAEAGVRLTVSGHGNQPGLGTHLEMFALAAGGMDELDVLRVATLNGYEALGLDQDLGSLEVGKLADLVILSENPLEDIRNSMSTRYIMINGRILDATDLSEIWPERRSTQGSAWSQ